MSVAYKALLDEFSQSADHLAGSADRMTGSDDHVTGSTDHVTDRTLQDMHKDALKIISHSLNLSSLIPELHNWVDQEDPGSLLSWVNLKINSSKEFCGFSVTDVLESLIIQSVAAAVNRGDVAALERLGHILRMLNQSGHLNSKQVQAEFDFGLQSPGVSVALHEAGLFDIEAQMDVTWKDQEKKVKKFLVDLVHGAQRGGDSGSAITALLVKIAFSESSSAPAAAAVRKKRAHTLLLQMMKRILDDLKKNPSDVDYSWLGSLKLPHKIATDWKLFILSFVLRHDPEDDLMEVLRSQENIHSSLSIKHGIPSLLHGVMQGGVLSPVLISDLLSRVLNRAQVNWTSMLTAVSLSLRNLPGLLKVEDHLDHAVTPDLEDHTVTPGLGDHLDLALTNILTEAVKNQNKETFLGGLLVSRQACLEGGCRFSSYPAWYSAKFCSTNHDNSVITTSIDADFVLDQLIDLVPVDPEFALRAQLSQQVRLTASGLKSKMDTYRQLARTQLIDLSNQKSSIQTVHELSTSILNVAKGLVCEWDKSHKIPGQIMEATMFKQPFYQNQLLPALMICSQDSSQLDTARNQLIEELNSRGKVAGHLYKDFCSGEIGHRYKSKVELPSLGVQNEKENVTGKVSLETLEEILAVLVNLPPDFQQELEASLQRLETVLNTLLPKKGSGRTVENGHNENVGGRREILTSLSSTLQQTGCHGFVGQRISKIMMDNLQCKEELVYCLLYGNVDDAMINNLAEIFKLNTKFSFQKGGQLSLAEYLLSDQHVMDKVSQLENLFRLSLHLRQHDPDSYHRINNRTALDNLMGMRSAVKHMSYFAPEPMTASEVVKTVLLQLRLKDDHLEQNLQNKLFSKLIQGAGERDENEKIKKIMESLFPLLLADESMVDHAAPLLTCLVHLDRESFLEAANELLTASSKCSLAVVEAVSSGPGVASQAVSTWSPSEYSHLSNLVHNTRHQTRLLVPLRAVEILAEHDHDKLTPAIQYSLAHYQATGLVDHKDKEMMEANFDAIFSWHRDQPSQVKTNRAATIMVGIVKLGELYLNGQISLTDKFQDFRDKNQDLSHVAQIVNKIKLLVSDLSKREVDELLKEASANPYDSHQIMQSSKIMLLKTFLDLAVPCPLYLAVNLIPLLTGLTDSGTLSRAEVGMLVPRLTRKLDTFPSDQVKRELQNIDNDLTSSYLSDMLAKYFNL